MGIRSLSVRNLHNSQHPLSPLWSQIYQHVWYTCNWLQTHLTQSSLPIPLSMAYPWFIRTCYLFVFVFAGLYLNWSCFKRFGNSTRIHYAKVWLLFRWWWTHQDFHLIWRWWFQSSLAPPHYNTSHLTLHSSPTTRAPTTLATLPHNHSIHPCHTLTTLEPWTVSILISTLVNDTNYALRGKTSLGLKADDLVKFVYRACWVGCDLYLSQSWVIVLLPKWGILPHMPLVGYTNYISCFIYHAKCRICIINE